MISAPWLTCTFRQRGGGWVCASVAVEGGIIVETAPVLAKFRGQPVENLIRWVRGLGGETEWLR